ncbi:ATP-binding protein [uncultured Pelagimonas sp.]|uniref:ATP-binding protein n=1 Tax=uncultured Pelagimonas sp. TaxID=1618102 RepID=UPI002607E1EC|nr:ATP-binding protein [uncultured Pelagimonas sp.]
MPITRGGIPGDELQQNLRAHYDPLFRVVVLLSFVALVINVYRVVVDGPMYHSVIQLVVVAVMTITLSFRHRFSQSTVACFLMSAFFVGCVVGLLRLGLGAAALLAFVLIPMFLVVLSSYKNAIFSLFGIALTILIVGYLHVSGGINSESNLADQNREFMSWLILALVFTNVTYAAVYITDRLRSYWSSTFDDLKSSHDEVNALIEHSPTAILIYDVDSNSFVRANPRAAELFSTSADELTGKPTYLDLFAEPVSYDPATTQNLQDHILAALGGETRIFETELLPPRGAPVVCELTLNHLPLDGRRFVRFTAQDIRHRKEAEIERKSLEAQLAQSQRLEAVGKLSGGVAHDFNNLLAVILGNAEMLRDATQDTEQLAMLDSITSSVQRGADLTQNMLSFARKARLNPQVIDLNEIVRDLKNWAGRTVPANIDVEVSLLAGLWPIEVDQSALQNAILNLLINARDVMPDGGKLTIETANLRIDDDYIVERGEEVPPGRYTLLAISDTGSGIPESTINRIFEPFFSTKPAGKGSGLGLSMVLGFMRQSGGTVRVYSEPGEGTTFKLYFPTSKSSKLSEAQKTANRASLTKGGQTVLVVEDEPELLDLLVTTLSNAGYNVVAASSGDEAFEVFQRSPGFDLLLTDIVMPGTLQGTSLSRALRELNPDLPAVFMSGYASEATVHGNGLRPEDIRLMKPVTRSALLAALDKALKPATPPEE